MYPVKIQKKASLLIKKCLKKKIKLSFAESCTGGLLSSLITSFPNSSKIFISGFVAYSNLSKERMLGVKSKTLKKYGAVSQEIAKEMVNGVWRKNKINIAVSITGIAGPTGQTKDKKIGLVYIGIKSKKGTNVNEFNFKGDRKKIRLKFCRKIYRFNILSYLIFFQKHLPSFSSAFSKKKLVHNLKKIDLNLKLQEKLTSVLFFETFLNFQSISRYSKGPLI